MRKKECFKCHRRLKRSEFYKHPQMADGLLGKCKDCTKKDVQTRYENHFDKIQAYEKSRSNLPHRVALRKAYYATKSCKTSMGKARKRYAHSEHGKIVKANSRKQYRKNYPEKYRAHQLVMNAIRNGMLIKKPCEKCKSKSVHAHHDDYSKPLKVKWLCPACHKEYHVEEKKGPL
jgi:hypothetical protein